MKSWNIGILEYWKGFRFSSFHYSIIPVISMVLILPSLSSYSQVNSNKNLFHLPLDTALVLSGTFAEIRTNHFHSGIDISTNETEGKEVYAAADGYVSRIKVAPDGFGKALYITHRNGYVTVYGHLQRYNDTLEKVVLAEQYKRESFAVEIFPPENQFPVKQGELIAFSGNTGGSSGPHLHFEIRDEKTEEPLNVLDFGFNFMDTIPPQIESVVIYPQALETNVNGKLGKKIIPLIKKGKNYVPADTSLMTIEASFNFGIETFDTQFAGGNDIGVKSVEVLIDGKKIYDYSINRFRFDETKYVNANIDYEERMESGKKIIVCHRLPADNFSGLVKDSNSIQLFADGKMHKAVFKVTDFHYNTSEAVVNFASPKFPTLEVDTAGVTNDTTFLVWCKKPFSGGTKDFHISTGKLPFIYESIFLTVSRKKGKKLFSKIYKIGEPAIPVHNAFNLSIKPEKLPKWLFPKALIAKVADNGTISSGSGTYKDGFVSASVSTFGNYAVAVDTVSPVIKATNLSTHGENEKIFFKIKISDELSGIDTYRATVNNKWLLMEYDAKTGTLTGQKPITEKGTYTFTLIVTDKKGNKSKYSTVMTY